MKFLNFEVDVNDSLLIDGEDEARSFLFTVHPSVILAIFIQFTVLPGVRELVLNAKHCYGHTKFTHNLDIISWLAC